MTRSVALVLGMLVLDPSSALAAVPDAGADLDTLAAEVDRDYARALGDDCATACRALESIRRATSRLCELDAGDRCAHARQKLADAAARVRTSCPECATATGEEGRTSTAPAPPPPSDAVQMESAPHKGGGCAGCTTAPNRRAADALMMLLGLAGLAALVARRRRR